MGVTKHTCCLEEQSTLPQTEHQFYQVNMAANSTLMFSGFNPNSRNSSKVLRPPGGGSSDIFGIKGDQEQEKVETLVQDEKDNLITDDPKYMSSEKIPNNAQEVNDEVLINANEEPSEVPNNANVENKSEESDIQEKETEANKFPAENSESPATAATSSPCPP